MFRFLIVDDDRAGSYLLAQLMKNLPCQPELHFVWDGVEALDFLHRSGDFADAPRPDLIVLPAGDHELCPNGQSNESKKITSPFDATRRRIKSVTPVTAA